MEPAKEKKYKITKKNENFIKDEELFFEYAKNPGNNKLRNILLLKNQALVVYIVNKYYSTKKEHKEKREDLLQEGTIGLLSAIDGFKPELGFLAYSKNNSSSFIKFSFFFVILYFFSFAGSI